MVDRLFMGLNHQFWVLLAFWLGFKIALLTGVLAVVALAGLGVTSSWIILSIGLPPFLWAAWVFKDFGSFAARIKHLLRLN